MKRLLPLLLLFICISCLTEESADPGKGKTFFRYFNGGYDDQAYAFDETYSDRGFIILATTQLTNSIDLILETKIKLIKTDRYGNETWRKLYPSFDSANPSYYKGRGMLVETDGNDAFTGFTIVGDSIDATTNVSYPFVLQTDEEGNPVQSKSYRQFQGNTLLSFTNVEGIAISRMSDGYMILGARKDGLGENMILARLRNDLSLEWAEDYGSGETTNINSLFTSTENDDVFWGGTLKREDEEPSDIRLVKTVSGSAGVIDDPALGGPESNEEIGSICYMGGPAHIIGTTDKKGSKDILYKKISPEGIEITFPDGDDEGTSIIIGNATTPEEGNAICTTTDHGVVIIGTTGLNEEQDYYLIKLNYLGEVTWSKVFGSKKADRGVSVKQIRDGSYVVLGNTVLGGLSTIMFTKRDSKGNIE